MSSSVPFQQPVAPRRGGRGGSQMRASQPSVARQYIWITEAEYESIKQTVSAVDGLSLSDYFRGHVSTPEPEPLIRVRKYPPVIDGRCICQLRKLAGALVGLLRWDEVDYNDAVAIRSAIAAARSLARRLELAPYPSDDDSTDLFLDDVHPSVEVKVHLKMTVLERDELRRLAAAEGKNPSHYFRGRVPELAQRPTYVDEFYEPHITHDQVTRAIEFGNQFVSYSMRDELDPMEVYYLRASLLSLQTLIEAMRSQVPGGERESQSITSK